MSVSAARGQPLGVIDSIASGFGIVTRRPLLMLLPVLVEAAMRLAPGAPAGVVARGLLSQAYRRVADGAAGPDELLGAGLQLQQAERFLEGVNLLGVISWQVPSVAGVFTQGGPWWGIGSLGGAGGVLGFLAGMAALGLLLACLYLAPMALAVRYGRVELRAVISNLWKGWLRLTGLRLLAGAILVGLVLVGILFFTGAGPLGAGVVSLVAGALVAGALLLALYLFLSEEAVFVGGASPVGALRDSAGIVYRHFWPALGLWLLVSIIGVGMLIIWQRLDVNWIGSAVAILGNAYIASGLTAAVMVFYKERRGRALS